MNLKVYTLIYTLSIIDKGDAMKPKIAIVGEYYDTFEPHTALNKSLGALKPQYDFEYEWLDTVSVEKEQDSLLKNYSGIWSAPGSPFKSLNGALYAITFARLKDVPHLGTCAGFQHAVIELARNVLGIEAAQHEEYDSQSSTLFVNKLVCSLAGKTMDVFLKSGTLAHRLYGLDETKENYYCNFGINPAFKQYLNHPQIAVAGVDQDDEIRIIELNEHRFFIATLFVPQTRSKPDAPHPIIKGFIDAACNR
jgi:CTP synthase (UTP-ammonia lyase)